MIVAANSHICGNTFLREVIVSPVDADEIISGIDDESISSAIATCRSSGQPIIVNALDSDSLAGVVCLPVYSGSCLRSIVTLVLRKTEPSAPGVVELWAPRGPYDDLQLRDGYFANLDRFHNVSSFVQFEKGAGLPGLAWELGRSVIHDQLATHPGFVRAAGASADALETAIGIPIFADQFLATCVLISSRTAPLARAMEVWIPTPNNEFELIACAYAQIEESLKFSCGAKLSGDTGLVGHAADAGTAVASEEYELLHAGRGEGDPGKPTEAFPCAVAIPTYVNNRLTCITMLVL